MLLVQDKQMFFSISLKYTHRTPQQDSVGTKKGTWGPLYSEVWQMESSLTVRAVGLKAGITS